MRHSLGAGILLALWCVGDVASAAAVPTMVRGGRTILMRPEVGTLTLRITKRDLNIYEGEDTLKATLYGPLGEELASLEMPGGGNAEGELTAELTADIQRPGTYRLAVTCSHDLIYGLETNCERLVLEGLIMLNQGGFATPIVFQPPEGEFDITAQALHNPGIQKLPIRDAGGVEVHVFDLAEAGQDVTFTVPEDVGDRTGLWTLDVTRADMKATIEGVSVWSTDASHYWAAERTRWMLLPRLAARYAQPGDAVTLPFKLRNSTGQPATYAVELTAPEGLTCELSTDTVELAKDGLGEVEVRLTVPNDAAEGDVLTGYVASTSQTDPDVVESAGFEVRVGGALVSKPLDLPIIHQRFRHEDVQFGYTPDYMTNEVYFDPQNRPFIRQRTESLYLSTGIFTLGGGGWTEMPFSEGLDEQYPGWKSGKGAGGFLGAKVAFGGEGDAYTCMRIVRGNGKPVHVLIHRPLGDERYFAYELPGNAFDIEQFSGHNALPHPPPVLAYVQTATHPATFCSHNDLLLFLPRKVDGKLELGEPVKVTDNCLGSCQHSGGPPSTATRDGKTHIVWGEVAEDDAPGVPTYIATYDHATGELGKKVLLLHGPPVNDVHNVPAVCQDSAGTIHVVSGAHGAPFMYRRSLEPNDAYSGWSEAVPVLSAGYISDATDADSEGRQTYISLLCGLDDTLHIAYRQWRLNADEHMPGSMYAALSTQSKPKGGAWGPARPLVVPPVAGYSIWYHKLTIDRRGRLYLSYNHWTSNESYQNEFPGRYTHRAVITSADGGRTWKLAETSDFLAGIQ